MSKVIEISEEVYREIEEEAAASGTTPAEWIAAQLPKRPRPSKADESAPVARTLADEFAGRVGRLASGRSDLSERVSELFAEGMVEKRRAGRL